MTPAARIILREVAEQTGVSVGDLLGRDRHRPIVHARQLAMYRLYELRREDGRRRFSLPQVGVVFGVDHTTVLHASRATAARLAELAEAA